MPEIRDPAIKLFGKTIALLPADSGGGGGGDGEEDKGHPTEKTTTASEYYREEENPESEENSEHVSSPAADDNHKHSSDDQETAHEEEEEEEEEDQVQTDSSNPLLKKPDKILPCPRCNSLETKFCYYNNYNVNQPRHFCRNCQRYWTAGGAMRNVPVGAGRRKNKNPVAAPLYHHLTVSDHDVDLQAVAAQRIHRPPLRSGGSVLSFGSDARFPEKATDSCHRNGLHRVDTVTPASRDGTVGDANEPSIRNCQSFTPRIPWPFPWNPPPVCVSSYPMPFHPAAAAAAAAAAYWGCAPWSLPWLTSPPPPPDSPALGKHSREEDGSGRHHHRLWIPKTLRIHDREEAAKSPIWATMGFESDESTTEGCRGFFKAFQTKGEPSGTGSGEASRALRANPAALSRSVSFLESSQVTDFGSIDAL